MTLHITTRVAADSHMKSLAADRRLCRRLVAASLPFFVVEAAVKRLLPGVQRRDGRRLSLVAEARAKASITIPFLFMG